MALLPYKSPVPCYHTDDITRYSATLFGSASAIYEKVRGAVSQKHCKLWEGSFSIFATTSDETAAKIVMYERRVGKWHANNDPHWREGVYIWIRANDQSGAAFEKATLTKPFAHDWAVQRFTPNRAVSVAPNPMEHFYYFLVIDDDDIDRIVALLAFCSTL